jgi:hypothetical protein
MSIIGLPAQQDPPKYTISSFCVFCPKLKPWVTNKDNLESFKELVSLCKDRINYAYWGYEWKYAMSLAVAHYICITDPEFVQSIGADSTAGGVMSSRSVGDISYSYEVDKFMEDNPAYKFWNTTGYGRQLVALSLARGYVGFIITT